MKNSPASEVTSKDAATNHAEARLPAAAGRAGTDLARSEAAVYRLRNVERKRSDDFRLDVDDLTIDRGEVLCLVGPTGAGKTTLLSVLSGLVPIDGGRLWIAGHASHEGPLPLAKQRTIAAVTQRPLPLLGTVRRNVECGLRWRGDGERDGECDERNGARIEELVDDVLARFRLRDIAKRSAKRLSGGQLQLVALARALVLRPDVLLLDEPTAALDPARVALVESLLADERSRRPMTVVWATHHLFQARRVADRVMLLLDGRNVETQATESFFETPSEARTAAFVRGEMIY